MPKDKQAKDEQPATTDYPFVLRSLTLKDLSKVPGAERYSSREYGVPYATFELGWPGRVRVPMQTVDDLGGVDDLVDLETMGLAVGKLMRWLKATGAKVGQEILADIRLDAADAALGDVPGVDINEL